MGRGVQRLWHLIFSSETIRWALRHLMICALVAVLVKMDYLTLVAIAVSEEEHQRLKLAGQLVVYENLHFWILDSFVVDGRMDGWL